MAFPNFELETKLWQKDFSIIGIDEVGRGAFAGPVTVGGVVFNPKLNNTDREYILSFGINDSKKLSSKKREFLSTLIYENAIFYNLIFIDVATINKIGIGKATFLGMRKVVKNLSQKISNPYVLVDAFTIPDVALPQKGIIHGDSLSISIAAASIIAKTKRDSLMQDLSKDFEKYGWEDNKGYGTLKHRQAISEFGLTKHHRIDFCKKVKPFVV